VRELGRERSAWIKVAQEEKRKTARIFQAELLGTGPPDPIQSTIRERRGIGWVYPSRSTHSLSREGASAHGSDRYRIMAANRVDGR
jgi:hypothetical protein